MAQLALNRFQTETLEITNSVQTAYTAPTGYTAIILYAHVTNIGTTAETFTMSHVRSSTTTEIIKNAKRICKKEIIIVDIAPEYKPSNVMLTGEPYILDYLKNIRDTFVKNNFTEEKLINNHVTIWNYKF